MTAPFDAAQLALIEAVKAAYESGHKPLSAAVRELTAAKIGPIMAVKALGLSAGTAINALARETGAK